MYLKDKVFTSKIKAFSRQSQVTLYMYLDIEGDDDEDYYE